MPISKAQFKLSVDDIIYLYHQYNYRLFYYFDSSYLRIFISHSFPPSLSSIFSTSSPIALQAIEISFLDAGCVPFTIKMSPGDALLNAFLHTTSGTGHICSRTSISIFAIILTPLFEKEKVLDSSSCCLTLNSCIKNI